MIKEVALPRHLTTPQLDTPIRNRFDNLVQRRMHIASCLVDNPSNTFYFHVDDNFMKYFGIVKGSIVVVDKSIPAESGRIIVCCVDDEWLIRKLCTRGASTFLCINNNFDACINITGKDIKVIGVVTWTCQPHT